MKVLINNQQNYRQLDRTKIKKIAQKILSLLEQPKVELSILFVDNKKMRQLNAIFRGIDRPTDVLSFPQISKKLEGKSNKLKRNKKIEMFPASHILLGDIAINTQMAASQAKISKIGFYDEVCHLLVHGILHLLGYDHEKSKYNTMSMLKKEKEILNAIKEMG